MTLLRRALVTGGCGFVGSHLTELLVDQGCSVTIVDDLSSGSLANVSPIRDRIDLYIIDIGSREFHSMVADGDFDAIFHLAAQAYVPPSVNDPSSDFRQNLDKTFKLLETLRISHWPGIFIFASSAAVYGDPSDGFLEEDAQVDPISPYGVSKLAAERYTSVYSRLYELRAASIRFFSMYGPRQTKQVIFDFIDKVYHDPTHLQILGDGTQVRDFCYIRDAVEGILLIAQRGALQGEVYNLASGISVTIDDLARQICLTMDCNPQFEYTGSIRPGDPECWRASIDHLQQLGFEPRYSLEAGIDETVEWYLETSSFERSS